MQKMSQHYRNWLNKNEWHIALTLNFDANVTKEQAEGTASYFWNKLDCELFGARQARKQNMRLPRACFLEGENRIRNWHYHCAVQLPMNAERIGNDVDEHVLAEEFAKLLKTRWEQLKEAGRYSVSELIENKTKWIDYICKEEGFGDSAFCARTSHLAA